MALRGDESVGRDGELRVVDGVALPSSFDQFAKRVFDIVVATLKIVLFVPILLITSIAIKLNSPGQS